MKEIIKNSDGRFKLLPELWDRISSDQLKITRYTSGGGLQYVIPRELVINEFERYSGRGNLISASKKYDSYAITYRFEKLLMEACELTKEQYYQLMMLRSNDLDNVPRCCICGKILPFSGKLGQGYHQGAGNIECEYYTCSASCKSSKVLIDGWSRGVFDDSTDKRGFAVVWKNNPDKIYNSVHNVVKEAEVSRAKFLSRSNGRKSYFYIAINNDLLKLGITSHHPSYRLDYVRRYILGSIDNVICYSGSDIEVANMEYNIKLLLHHIGITSTELGSETFNYSNKLLELIKTKVSESLKLFLL